MAHLTVRNSYERRRKVRLIACVSSSEGFSHECGLIYRSAERGRKGKLEAVRAPEWIRRPHPPNRAYAIGLRLVTDAPRRWRVADAQNRCRPLPAIVRWWSAA